MEPTSSMPMLKILTMDAQQHESRTQALIRNVEARMAVARLRMDNLDLPKKKQKVRSWEKRLQEGLGSRPSSQSTGESASRPGTALDSFASAVHALTAVEQGSFGSTVPTADQPLRALPYLPRPCDRRPPPNARAPGAILHARQTLEDVCPAPLGLTLLGAAGSGSWQPPKLAGGLTGTASSIRQGLSAASPTGGSVSATPAVNIDREARAKALKRWKEMLGPMQAPSPAEIASLDIPPLERPSLDPSEASIGEVIQWRMERIWRILKMPALDKMDMVIKYSCWGESNMMEHALACWENVCAAVLFREKTLERLVKIQEESEKEAPSLAVLKTATEMSKTMLMVTQRVHDAAEELLQNFDDVLTYDGRMYPGADALRVSHLVQFCDRIAARAAELQVAGATC